MPTPHAPQGKAAPAPSGAWDASTYEWRPVAIGAGGYITGFSADATGATRVIRTDVHGAYIWRGDKDRWVQLITTASMPASERAPLKFNEGAFEVAVAPSDPKRIYVAIAGGVYRSGDGGESFVRTTMPFSHFDPNSEYRFYGPYMAVSPSDPNLVLFGTPETGVWRTEDGGATWAKVPSAPGAPDSKSNGRSPGVVLWFTPDGRGIWAVATGSGVYSSNEGGRTFHPLAPAAASQPKTLRQGAFAPDGAFYGVDHDGQAVWKFAKGAWTELTHGAGLEPARFGSVAVNPRTGEVFVFDEGGRVWRSGDAGSSWAQLRHSSRAGQGDPPWLHVANVSYFATAKVVFDPKTPNRMWSMAGTGAYFADVPQGAGQIVWTSQARGIEELVANDVVSPTGQSPLFAAWDFGIHVKDDLTAFSTTYGPKERVVIAAQQLDWSPSDPAFIVTNASDTRTHCCSQDGNAVMAGYSRDGGRTWSKFATLPQPPGTSPTDPWRMSFGTIAVAANDSANIVWEPTFNRSPYFTKDRGESWSRVVLPGETLPDTGSHAALHLHRKTLAADRVLPGTFYLVHSGDGANAALAGLWVTRDGGSNWTRVFSGEIAPSSRGAATLRAVPGKAGHLFFTSAVSSGPDTALRRSVDGGRSWRIVQGVDRVDDVGFGKTAPGADYPTIFVTGRVNGKYGVWRSINDAETWSEIAQFAVGSLDQVVVVSGDMNVFGRVYLGYLGSGWAFGQPSNCKPHPYAFGDAVECFGLRAAE